MRSSTERNAPEVERPLFLRLGVFDVYIASTSVSVLGFMFGLLGLAQVDVPMLLFVSVSGSARGDIVERVLLSDIGQ